MTPTWLPSEPMSRTSGTRIRKLARMNVLLMAVLLRFEGFRSEVPRVYFGTEADPLRATSS